jgi:hypothetical protein
MVAYSVSTRTSSSLEIRDYLWNRSRTGEFLQPGYPYPASFRGVIGPSVLAMPYVTEEGGPPGLGVRIVRRSERELKFSMRVEEPAETAFLLIISTGKTVAFETSPDCKMDELGGDAESLRVKWPNSSAARETL